MDLECLQPQLFKDFNQILKSDRMNHAYLFSGDFASFDFALYLAKSRFCENLHDGRPCGKCRECQLIDDNDFSDVKVVKPTGQIIKTETIQGCEKMHVNAANSLLKFIEEPQSSSYMILLTSDESKVLPTIKSRTQVFRFPKNKKFLVEQAEKAGILKTQADILAELAKTPAHLDELMADKKILDLLQTIERFISILFKDKATAYLETGHLVQATLEKSEQELVFQLLPLFLAKQFNQKESLTYLEKSYRAQQMWRSNVSFQNVLEYMVIS